MAVRFGYVFFCHCRSRESIYFGGPREGESRGEHCCELLLLPKIACNIGDYCQWAISLLASIKQRKRTMAHRASLRHAKCVSGWPDAVPVTRSALAMRARPPIEGSTQCRRRRHHPIATHLEARLKEARIRHIAVCTCHGSCQLASGAIV